MIQRPAINSWVQWTFYVNACVSACSRKQRSGGVGNFGHWITRSADSTRLNLLPALTDRLANFLDDEENWQTIDRGCVSAMGWIKNQLVDYVKLEQGQDVLKDRISQAVRQLNVTTLVQEQVMKLDTDELENMILNNTGGNLVVIQVLGGGLGMIAGLVQVQRYRCLD